MTLTFAVHTPSVGFPLDPMVVVRSAFVHGESIIIVTALLPNEVEPLYGLGLSLGLDPGFCDLARDGPVQPRCSFAGHFKVQRVCAVGGWMRAGDYSQLERKT